MPKHTFSIFLEDNSIIFNDDSGYRHVFHKQIYTLNEILRHSNIIIDCSDQISQTITKLYNKSLV